MARKAILEGGKRDEIIEAATEMFFTEGYESTSVRKVLKAVNGEVGMFYHYFSSKEELFDVCADRFFRNYAENFETMTASAETPEMLVEQFLPAYEKAMEQYRIAEGRMHWTVRMAFHERTLLSLIPAVTKLLVRFGYCGAYPLDIAAARLTADVSAVIHSLSFAKMNEEEKKQLLLRVIYETLDAR